LTEEELNALDPALQELAYDVGDGPQTTLVYVEPPVETMYPPGEEPPSRTKVTPKFNGLAGKFINMSNKKVTLYWYVGSTLHGGQFGTATTLVILGRKLSSDTTTRSGSHSRVVVDCLDQGTKQRRETHRHETSQAVYGLGDGHLSLPSSSIR
jgi:hypothetical protein